MLYSPIKKEFTLVKAPEKQTLLFVHTGKSISFRYVQKQGI